MIKFLATVRGAVRYEEDHGHVNEAAMGEIERIGEEVLAAQEAVNTTALPGHSPLLLQANGLGKDSSGDGATFPSDGKPHHQPAPRSLRYEREATEEASPAFEKNASEAPAIYQRQASTAESSDGGDTFPDESAFSTRVAKQPPRATSLDRGHSEHSSSAVERRRSSSERAQREPRRKKPSRSFDSSRKAGNQARRDDASRSTKTSTRRSEESLSNGVLETSIVSESQRHVGLSNLLEQETNRGFVAADAFNKSMPSIATFEKDGSSDDWKASTKHWASFDNLAFSMDNDDDDEPYVGNEFSPFGLEPIEETIKKKKVIRKKKVVKRKKEVPRAPADTVSVKTSFGEFDDFYAKQNSNKGGNRNNSSASHPKKQKASSSLSRYRPKLTSWRKKLWRVPTFGRSSQRRNSSLIDIIKPAPTRGNEAQFYPDASEHEDWGGLLTST